MTDIFRELKRGVDFDFEHNDAYTVVSQMLVEWCEARGRYFSDLIIKIKVGDYEDVVFESFDSNDYCFVSDYDWWEGEDTIQILDIKRLDDVFDDDKYNIDVVRAGNENNDELGDVEFWSNNQKLAFHEYTGYKRERQSMQESGRAPVGVFSNISTFYCTPEYYPEKEEE